MAAETQQIVVEFVSDTSQLQPGIDQLAQLGDIDAQAAAQFKSTNDQLKQRQAIMQQMQTTTNQLATSTDKVTTTYNKLSQSLNNLSGASKEAVQELLKFSPEDIAKGFDDAAVSVDDYLKVLENSNGATNIATGSTVKLRTELQNLKNQMAEVALSSGTNSTEFTALAQRAGVLSNALQNANKITQALGSDAPLVKVLGTTVQSLAGGFQAAIGAAALFGDQQKDFQEVLVKVNAATAVAQGLGQALNLVRSEAALTEAKLAITRTLNNAQLAIQNGLESDNIILVGLATIAQKALNLAMEASPIGLFIAALSTIVGIFAVFISRARGAAEAEAELENAADNANESLQNQLAFIDQLSKKQVSDLEISGARRSAVLRQQLKGEIDQYKARQEAIEGLQKSIDDTVNNLDDDVQRKRVENIKKLNELQGQQDRFRIEAEQKNNEGKKELLKESLQDAIDNAQTLVNVTLKNDTSRFNAQRSLARANAAKALDEAGQDEAKVNQVRSQLHRELLDIQEAQEKDSQQRIIAIKEDALIKAQVESRRINSQISDEEVADQNRIILARAKLEASGEEVTQQQRKEIIDKANAEVEQNNREQVARNVKYTEEKQIELNDIIISNVRTTNEDRLTLQIANVQARAAIEIAAVGRTSTEIKALEAKREEDIRKLKIDALDKQVEDEITIRNASFAQSTADIQKQLAGQANFAVPLTAGYRQALEQVTGVFKLSISQQKDLVDELHDRQLANITDEESALNKKLKDGLISNQKYVVDYAKLKDQEKKIEEDTENAKLKIDEDALQKKRELIKSIIQAFQQASTAAVSTLNDAYQADFDARENAIQKQRADIQALSDAGDISAKEAKKRNLDLDEQEKKLQRQKAKRDKEIALFNAIIQTAVAVATALTGGPVVGVVLAAITAALGAAEIAIIASKPLPQFNVGKQGQFEGLGVIAERHPEIFETAGKRTLVSEPTIMFIGRQDKVYNPSDTQKMLEHAPMNMMNDATLLRRSDNPRLNINYDKIGLAVAKHVTQNNWTVDEDGFSLSIKKGHDRIKYLNNRRSWFKK